MKHSKGFLRAALTTVALTFTATAVFAEGTMIAVVGGKADDPFFAKVKKGIDDGTLVVEAHGGTVNYLMLQNYDNIGGDAANLVRTAISQGASVIAVPNWVPDTQDEAIKAAMDAGIPVMLYNAGGGDKAKELGAINYIGNEEYPAGVAGGEYFGSHGQKNVICVNTVPGAQNLEDRCRGIADGITPLGGVSNQLPLPASSFGDPTAVAEAIKATLLKDPTIDGLSPFRQAMPTVRPSASSRQARQAKWRWLRSTWTRQGCSASKRAISFTRSTSSRGCRASSL